MTTESHTQELAKNKTRRIEFIPEPDDHEIIFEGRMKQLTGVDSISYYDEDDEDEINENIEKGILTKQQPYCKECRNALIVIDKIKVCCNKCKYIRLMTDQEIRNCDHAQTYPELYLL